MTAMDHHDVEVRLSRAFKTPLPAAPASLLDRLDGVPVARVAPGRGRFRLMLAPVAVAALLVAVALAGGSGHRPVATASPSPFGPTGLFTPVPIDALEGAAAMDDIWPIGERFAGMLWGVDGRTERAAMVLSDGASGSDWRLVAPPRDGFVLAAGTPMNGQIHVLGYTGTFDDPVWWHEAMDRNGIWHEVGQVTGIPASTHVLEMTHGAAGWLARIGVLEPAPEAGRGESQIRYSSDGLTWADPAVPEDYEPETMYTGVGTDGTALLVFRYFDIDGYHPRVVSNEPVRAPTEVIRSTDGREWTVDVLSETSSGPRFMAFNGQRFAGIGSAPTDEPDIWHAAAWFSETGRTWERGFLHQSTGPVSESIRAVTASLDGRFVAVGSANGEIWTSTDGKIWQWFPALAPGETWNPYAVALLGNEIVVAGPGPDGRPVVWVRRPSRAILE